jgi:hypothetical protein
LCYIEPVKALIFADMEKFDETLITTIARLANYFALEVVQQWAANIRRKKITNTGELLRSLDQEVRPDLSRLVVAIDLAFEEYGRFQEIKNKRWRYQPPIDDLYQWVISRGIGSFGRDPRPNKRKPKTPERRANEIAWGIARQRLKRKKDKVRPWMRGSFQRSLTALQDELNLGIKDRALEQMIETLAWRMKRSGAGKFTV